MIKSIADLSDIEVVARTVWGEARGEGPAGWTAVAWVIKNRAARPGWWGHDLRTVCLCPRQFSCWNPDDPNAAKALAVADDDPALTAIRATVEAVLSGAATDPTGRATHYHTRALEPAWASAMTPTAAIGAHEFYREA